MPKFRKKPVIIEAIQLTQESQHSIIQWCNEGLPPIAQAKARYSDLYGIIINTLEGPYHATFGDWIIKGVEGEFYPCKPDIFEKTYELVEGRREFVSDGCSMWPDSWK